MTKNGLNNVGRLFLDKKVFKSDKKEILKKIFLSPLKKVLRNSLLKRPWKKF